MAIGIRIISDKRQQDLRIDGLEMANAQGLKYHATPYLGSGIQHSHDNIWPASLDSQEYSGEEVEREKGISAGEEIEVVTLPEAALEPWC